MHKFFTLALISMFSSILPAQSTNNVIVYSEDGHPFYLIVNGLQINSEPQTNVKVTDLNQPGYRVKVIFADGALGEVDGAFNFLDMGVEQVYVVMLNKKGEYKMRGQSEVPLAQAAAPAPQQVIYAMQPGGSTVTQTYGMQTTVVATQTNTTVVDNGTNVSMQVAVPGMSMQVQVNDPLLQSESTYTETYSTTTTTTTSGYNSNETYANTEGCVPVGQNDYNSMKWSISSKSFEDSKLSMAKQITASNCVSAEQVRDIMLLFDFEETRLDFAKFAYAYTADKNNYYKVNDAFTFESSIDALTEYIHTH
ncbi:MAG: DUF4476 domain-containing protein [Chitinophagales bacterium]